MMEFLVICKENLSVGFCHILEYYHTHLLRKHVFYNISECRSSLLTFKIYFNFEHTCLRM